jgi:para-aminobenzoate synthetase/4-amino-4-deoxychorismate lyase
MRHSTPARPFEALIRTPWRGPWRRFTNPIAVLQADRPEDVAACLAEVDSEARARECFAAGFVTYEAAAAFGLPVPDAPPDGLPLVCFGLFSPDDVRTATAITASAPHRIGAWQPSIDHGAYLEAVRRIKLRIEAGDTYQINSTFRLSADFEGEPCSLMAELDAAQAGPWGAFVDTGRHAVCSASPELFFRVADGRIECRPMKGTAARGLHPAADAAQAETLRRSEKNRAENVMVVDMVRNDLGRIAAVGSVHVPFLFDVERYPAQWQMTSTVAASLADPGGPMLASLFEALFPSGSVTGAPKHSSMGIIRDLEIGPRGIYTGAIGYLSPRGRAHFNVAIRTVAVDRERGRAEFGVGSGIVWDSVDRDEYGECLLKASIVVPSSETGEHAIRSADFKLLETIGWTPAKGYVLLERHLKRLHASADYFGFECDMGVIRPMLDACVIDLCGPAKVRLRTGRDGTILCEAVDVAGIAGPLRAALAPSPVDSSNVFLYHKTTRRHVYDDARASRPDADAVILWNEAGEVTEATDYNVVVELDGRKVTPPVESGLLAGTLRADLLDSGEIEERRITLDELRGAARLWLINSVRGMVEARLVE